MSDTMLMGKCVYWTFCIVFMDCGSGNTAFCAAFDVKGSGFMSIGVSVVGTNSFAVLSRQIVTEQQRTEKVSTEAIKAGNEKVSSISPVRRSFGQAQDKIEISAEGRQALEKLYAAKAAQGSANANTAAPASGVKPIEAAAKRASESAAALFTASMAKPSAESAANPEANSAGKPAAFMVDGKMTTQDDGARAELKLPGTATAEEKAALEKAASEKAVTETESVSSAELESMSVTELRALVNSGTITQSEMDDELDRRDSISEQSEQKAAELRETIKETQASFKSINDVVTNLSTFNTTKQYAAVAQALS